MTNCHLFLDVRQPSTAASSIFSWYFVVTVSVGFGAILGVIIVAILCCCCCVARSSAKKLVYISLSIVNIDSL